MMTSRRLLYLLPTWLVLLAACSPQTPESLLSDAQKAIAAGETRTAEIHLEKLLHQYPEHAAAHLLLGEVSLLHGDASAAEQSLRKALKLGTDPVKVQVPLLRALLDQRKYDELRAQIAAGPPATGEHRIEVLAISAAAHRGQGSFEAAERDYRAALEIDPDSPGLRTEIAAVLLQSGRLEQCKALISDVLAAQPEFVPALLLRGAIEFQSARYAAAEATFARITKAPASDHAAPEYSAAIAQLVESQLAQGKVKDAAVGAAELLTLAPQSAVARYLTAKVEFQQGQVEGAAHRLESLIANFPEYWPAYAVLGSINAQQNHLNKAEMYLTKAVANSPGDRNSRMLLAQIYLRRGDIASAKKLFGQAGELAPTDGPFLALAGWSSRQLGETDLAAKYFERSEQQAPPETLQDLIRVSSVYFASGEFERAIRVLESSPLDGAKTHGVTDYLLALAQVKDGDLPGARSTALRLATEVPAAPWLLNLRGTIELLAGATPSAQEFFAGALKLDPNNVPALLNSAQAALAADNSAEAERHLLHAIKADPQQATAMAGLAVIAGRRRDFAAARAWAGRMPESAARFRLEGDIALEQGRFDGAATSFSRAFALQPAADLALIAYTAASRAGRPSPEAELLAWSAEHPRDPRVNFALGSIALGKRDNGTAIERYSAVLREQPNHVGALNNLAWLYSDRNDPRAIELANRAYKVQPDDPSVADTLGWLRVRRGEAAQGLPLLKVAVAKAPNNPEIRYHWAVALAETGDERQSREILRALLASDADFPGRGDAERRVARNKETAR